MPFKFKWPFRWPWRKAASPAGSAPEALPAPHTPGSEPEPRAPQTVARAVAASLAHPPPEPVLRAASAQPGPLPRPGTPEFGSETFEWGGELLARVPQLSTPPTLGRQGGLPAMAQTLPAVEKFMQNLPAPPVQRLLETGLAQTGDFAAQLPALASFGGPASGTGAPAFPEQLAPGAPLTDVLPPLGALPGQLPSISGEAPVLTPAGPTREVVRVITERAAPAPPEAASPTPPVAPLVSPPAPAPDAPHWPMTQVLPVESTLAGNVLPFPEGPPVLRTLEPGAAAGMRELAEPPAVGGERVSPEQRAAIESQRGQGAPLAPEVRQRFEQSYGQTLADVRIHTGQAAHTTAQSLNAIAFASGADLFFSQSTFRPDSPQGLGLIGHELAHVVQQQYGVPGDADALRPASDPLERQADRLAAAALETPLAEPASRAAQPVQRALVGTLPSVDTEPLVEPASVSAATLARSRAPAAEERPLGVGAAVDEPEPVQRFGLGSLGGLARQAVPQLPSIPESLPEELPSLDSLTERAHGLTDQLPNPGGMLANLGSLPTSLPDLGGLAQNLPSLSGLGGMLPSLPSGLPSLGNLPMSLGDVGGMIPGAQNALPAVQSAIGGLGNLGGGLPSLGSLTQNLPGGLTDVLPAVQGGVGGLLPGGLPEMPELPSLGGLQLPEMPLAEGLGGIGQALGGAAAAGQEALGTITSMAPSLPETPAAPPLPSLEKLTDHVWKQVQQKLKVERERARGLA